MSRIHVFLFLAGGSEKLKSSPQSRQRGALESTTQLQVSFFGDLGPRGGALSRAIIFYQGKSTLYQGKSTLYQGKRLLEKGKRGMTESALGALAPRAEVV